ncbi:hypothetical protein L2735_19220 [Shewanella olleyana]|uniref:hypothetical protein n=1 Tax=Shewanella olleyana TaxID=135626 RepID=UPI00200F95AF|nr:hypothetical protein [Shewanella olleyana]MCL1068895.1 hypothetical protein [Shewanella olleyana]
MIELQSIITATNNELLIDEGFNLVIVDKNGQIVRKDDSIKKIAFDEMIAEVTKEFSKKFRQLPQDNFK